MSRESEWQQLRRVIIDLVLETFAAERVALLLRRELQGDTLYESPGGPPPNAVSSTWNCAGSRPAANCRPGSSGPGNGPGVGR
ncbi:MAG: hypothetical protein U5J62_04795 [Desulfurivibrio sp.]|nr:hypothetical protein [Desulfurivibrio sp.]